MPEAFVVVLVLVMTVVAYVAAVLKSRDPVVPRVELARMQGQRAWLEERLEMARRERWDDGMVAEIERQLTDVARELDKPMA